MKNKNRSQSRPSQAASAPQPPIQSTLAEMQSIFDQALAFHRAGLLAEAETQYRRVLDVYPKSFDCQHLLGVISYQRGNYAAAIDEIDAALKINARIADAHFNRGNVLKKLQRPDEALESYDEAAALNPDDPLILNSRGTVLRELKQYADALADFDTVIGLKPDYAEAFNNRGNVHKDMGLYDAARADYDKAIALKPDNADAFNNRGNLHKELGELDQAVADYDKAIALKPDHAEAIYNRGTTLMELRHFDQALADYNKAIPLKPRHADALYNRGTMLMSIGRIEEAIANFDEAIALKPDHAEAFWNRAFARLLLGYTREGWDDYEARWRTDELDAPRRNLAQPRWHGDGDIAGKRILLHAEQGFGDTIMAARYARRVSDMGARVFLEVPFPLVPLMDQIEGITVLTQGQALPDFELQCPMMSLPRAFNATPENIPAEVPYLHVPAAHLEKWRQRLPRTGGLRVGLNWGGREAFKHDATRSIGLARMLPLLARADIQFFGLQKGLRAGDAEILREHPRLIQLGDEIETFADSAAIVSQLDLVISSDTAIVHLAGALARPVWVLLQFVPEWRWLLGRDDSPWYPTARLFRQDKLDDWSGVVDRVAAELARLS
jgi:tetratricopeptide (TPR) repeat protein